MAELKHEREGESDRGCEQSLRDLCDKMDGVHDAGTPIVALWDGSQIAPRVDRQQTQSLIVR
jgi:hypothetical protein